MDFYQALRAANEQTAVDQWRSSRRERILCEVSVFDVLGRFGKAPPHRGSRDRGQQICCPFHGDSKPSAKIYPPKSANEGGAVYCYVCRERWDVITLWKKFTDTTYAAAISQIEKEFGIVPDRCPDTPSLRQADALKQKADRLQYKSDRLKTCENRLRLLRELPSMMTPVVQIGMALDVLYSTDPDTEQFESGVKLVLEKIGNLLRKAYLK